MDELREIITKFSASGWEVIDAASMAWLACNNEVPQKVTTDLITAIRLADEECGNCGCEFDPLYKRALQLLEE